MCLVKGVKAVSGADGVLPILSVLYSTEDETEKLSLSKIVLTLSANRNFLNLFVSVFSSIISHRSTTLHLINSLEWMNSVVLSQMESHFSVNFGIFSGVKK
jgi:hypothetical protein